MQDSALLHENICCHHFVIQLMHVMMVAIRLWMTVDVESSIGSSSPCFRRAWVLLRHRCPTVRTVYNNPCFSCLAWVRVCAPGSLTYMEVHTAPIARFSLSLSVLCSATQTDPFGSQTAAPHEHRTRDPNGSVWVTFVWFWGRLQRDRKVKLLVRGGSRCKRSLSQKCATQTDPFGSRWAALHVHRTCDPNGSVWVTFVLFRERLQPDHNVKLLVRRRSRCKRALSQKCATQTDPFGSQAAVPHGHRTRRGGAGLLEKEKLEEGRLEEGRLE